MYTIASDFLVTVIDGAFNCWIYFACDFDIDGAFNCTSLIFHLDASLTVLCGDMPTRPVTWYVPTKAYICMYAFSWALLYCAGCVILRTHLWCILYDSVWCLYATRVKANKVFLLHYMSVAMSPAEVLKFPTYSEHDTIGHISGTIIVNRLVRFSHLYQQRALNFKKVIFSNTRTTSSSLHRWTRWCVCGTSHAASASAASNTFDFVTAIAFHPRVSMNQSLLLYS